jgi:subtilase family serine protease
VRNALLASTSLILISSMLLAFTTGASNESLRTNRKTLRATGIIRVPDDFETINEAIDGASAGDILYVAPGIYNESVIINKRISLVGEDREKTVICYNVTDNGVGVNICADCVVVTNFSITHTYEAVEISGRNCTISHSRITDCEIGISMENSEFNRIEDNDINCSLGIGIAESTCNVIVRNYVVSNCGIIGSGSASNVTWNTIEASGIGCYVEGENNGKWRLEENQIQPHGDQSLGGILLEGCNIVIKHNVFGISFETGFSAYIFSNNTTFAENIVVDNGIDLEADNCSFYHNDFNNSFVYTSPDSSQTRWDDCYPSGGNYWSDYIGKDIYSGPHQNVPGSDGICDTPYVIDGNNQDRYPLMNPIGSPPQPTCTLTITATDGGTINPPPAIYTYSQGQNVTVQATPNAWYMLDQWELDGASVGTMNPYSVFMDQNHTLHATFAEAVDLSLSSPDISFSDSNPPEGQTVTISARVHNNGLQDVENVTVQFLDGIELIDETQIVFISHSSTATTTIDWTAKHEGFHLIRVIVDPGNTIVETDKENNEATRSILVGEIPTFGGIVLNGSIVPNDTGAGSLVAIQGHAEYNTTYGAGEPVAGADVTVTIPGQKGRWTTHTIRSGDYTVDVVAPYSSGNYTVVVSVTDSTFSNSIEMSLTIQSSPSGVDLTLSQQDISFSPADPIENDNVTVMATIHNVGTDNVTNVLVAFYDNSQPIGNRTIDLIQGGESENTMIPWNATPRDWHTIKVLIDPENTIPELDENNNEAHNDIYVYPPLPDLTSTNIDFSDSTPLVNQTITISANVQNIGGISASNVLVSFYDGNESIGNTTIPWIAGKGDVRTTSIDYAFTTEGWHRISVFVDPDNSIAEADEGNNQYYRDIYVHLPLPDLTLSSSDITFSNSSPTIGDTITIYAAIHNIGENNASKVTVEIFADGVSINYVTIPFIPAGGQETVSTAWNATPVGWHTIQVIIDGNNTIIESNENNNMATRYVYICPLPEEAADLCVYSFDIVFSNTNPDPGENVTIYAMIHNIGQAEAQNITVTFYIDDIQLGLPSTIAPIPAGQYGTVSIGWVASQLGSHVVKVMVDAPLELDKNNNVATTAIIVGAPALGNGGGRMPYCD